MALSSPTAGDVLPPRSELVRSDARATRRFFSGCSDEQALFNFDLRVLLTAPESVIIERLQGRTSNSTATKKQAKWKFVLSDRRAVEPLLRRRADLIIDTTMPVDRVAALVIERVTDLINAVGG
jgi:hypothetical protein